MIQLQFRHKLLSMAGIAIAALALVSGVGLQTLERSDVSKRMVEANSVQRAQMDGDMMHDAIRADITLCSVSSDPAAIRESVAAIREHSQRMRDDIAVVAKSAEPEVVVALRELQAAFNAYLAEAEAYARAAEAAKLHPEPSFGEAFEELEAKMELLGDSIDAAMHKIVEEAAAARAVASRTNLWASVSCAAGLLVLSLVLVRSIRAPLQQMASVARALASGDVDQRIDVTSKDEIGELAEALRLMIAYIQDTTRAALSLGRGELDVAVSPRSTKDGLSLSFIEMRDSLSRLIRDSSSLIAAARAGDLSRRADPSGLSGAFREMIEGENALLAAVDAPLKEAKSVLARVEARDLTARMRGEYRGDYAAIEVSLNSAIETLERAMTEVASVADGVAAAAAQITSSSSTLARTASAQLSTIERVTSELDETTTASEKNAVNAEGSRANAVEAMNAATRGSDRMQKLSAAVEAMKEAADETSKIVRTIDEIAFQTNLLALNAAVEAERAGDAGRGFAVVAEEVRTLAKRSAEAARNTTQVIERSRKKADEGVALNRDASIAFDAIAGQVKKIAEAMTQIAESSQKQHAGVSRAASSADSIRDDAQSGAATAEETASAAVELAAQSNSLRQMTGDFTLGRGQALPARPEHATRRVLPARAAKKASFAVGAKPTWA